MLALECRKRNIPIAILHALLQTGPSLREAGPVNVFMQKYWRRLRHWKDIRDLAALLMRRDFDAPPVHSGDFRAAEAAKRLREDGFAPIGAAMTSQKAAEATSYLKASPGYNRHVPDGGPDHVMRYLGYGANDYSFCSYLMHDIIRAPHILEAAVNPTVIEIGQRFFGAVPRLWKIFTHWELPGSKFLPSGTSIGHYHRDLNDVGMMWMYIYLTDVGEDCGPHGVVPGSHDYDRVDTWLRDAMQWGIDCRISTRPLTTYDFSTGMDTRSRMK